MGPHALECALTFALLLTLAFPDTGFFQKRLALVTPPPLPLSGVLEDRAPRSLSFHLHLSFDLCLSFHFEFDVDELSFAIHVLFPLTVEPFQNRIYCWYLDWFRSLGGNLVVTESLKLWVLCDLFGQLMDWFWECCVIFDQLGVHHQRTPKTTTPFLLQLVILLGAEPDAGNDEGDEDEEDPDGHPNDDRHSVIFVFFLVTYVWITWINSRTQNYETPDALASIGRKNIGRSMKREICLQVMAISLFLGQFLLLAWFQIESNRSRNTVQQQL